MYDTDYRIDGIRTSDLGSEQRDPGAVRGGRGGREAMAEGRRPSVEWELDCYSRPVLQNKKKLWELLICDNTGALRIVQSIPANKGEG